MSTYLIGSGLILLLLLGGIAVQGAYGRFARRHPELGPYRCAQGGCGACAAGPCDEAGRGGGD